MRSFLAPARIDPVPGRLEGHIGFSRSMRRQSGWGWIGALASLALFLGSCPLHAADPSFAVSYSAGKTDPSGQQMGGTEIRVLARHGGKLFAGNGYWKDTGSAPGAQILVLDQPNGTWRVDHTFGDLLPRGRRRHLAVSALSEITFQRDGKGTPLASPVSLLLASTWDVTGARTVFTRDDATGQWSGAVLATGRPSPKFLPQVRAFGFHRDEQTGADLVFAGDSKGIFAGTYDPSAPTRIRWAATPEFAAAGINTAAFPGLAGRLRISSFAEALGHLYAAIGQQVWARQDGATPRWTLLYTNPDPRYSQTGLRGLTALSEPGRGPVLLAAAEGNAARIIRISPITGNETTDLDLTRFLDTAWGTRVSYVIAAYNDMTRAPWGFADGDLAIGLEAFIPPASPRPPNHTVLPVINGLEGGAWFLIRRVGGLYELHQVAANFPNIGQNLVAARTITVSPFPGESDTLYVGGYDANDTPAHDTGWIARARLDGAP
jgi:hypothetical protein